MIFIVALSVVVVPENRGSVTPSVQQHGTQSPVSFWRFEDANNTGIDTEGNCNLHMPKASPTTATPLQHAPTSSSVGSYLVFNNDKQYLNATEKRNWGATGCVNTPPADRNGAGAAGLTIEFLLQPTPWCFLRGGSTTLFATEHDTVSFSIYKDHFAFKANTSDTSAPAELIVNLEGAGVLASNYLWSYANSRGKWHHFALTKDAATGAQAIWIDGESQPSMQLQGSSTPSPTTTMPLTDQKLYINAARNPVALCAGLDEIAIYDTAISPELIFRHYREAVFAHLPYNPVANTSTPPNQTIYPGPDESSYYDMKAYAPGAYT